MTHAVSRRARRALLAAAVPAALAATALPANADAATARLVGSQLQYTAASGEANTVRVAFTGLHIFIDDNVPISAGNGCVIDERGNAICVPGSGQARYSLGDGRDEMVYTAPHAARLDMGAGDDTYFGALRRDSFNGTNGLVVQDADVIGGSGADLVTYRSAQGGVRVSLDGQFNDGNRGAENVRPDWEHVEGSDGIDIITGSDQEKVEQFTGRGGRDTISGGAGTDIFNEGSAPNGPDSFNGGSGQDRVNYGARTSGVFVNMQDLTGNDGAPGEGDDVDPNVNDIVGTNHADTLIGASGPNVINGLNGVDRIEGLVGNDRLIGGNGVDRLLGGPNDDTLDTADNTPDVIRCEGEFDTLNRDLQDVDATDCEVVNSVGILKLAPATISAEAGEVAKLKLSWTHPKSWKQLRKVTLRLREGNEVVGKIAIRPASGQVEDQGAVKVVHKQSKLVRKNKKLRAELALRISRRLADSTLDADVVATDVKGKRQVAHAAGSIQVSD